MTPEKPLRVFVIGGITGEESDADRQMPEIAIELGKRLGAKPNVQLVVCSAHPSSVDASVIEGFARTCGNKEGSVIVHHPLDDRDTLNTGESIPEQWSLLVSKTGLKKPQYRQNSEARVRTSSDLANAFLLCQIRALKENTDVIVALGGKQNASAALLLAIARGDFPIIPFSFLGGASAQEYNRQEASIRSSLKDQTLADSLQSPSGIFRIYELIEKLNQAHGRHHIFMSYSWERKEEADYVEAFLRRNPRITLFRDEEEIKTGEPISERIKQEIKRCDAFLMLWCAEYAASPNCYDELQIATKRDNCLIYVLRLDETRPVWPSLRKPRSHDWRQKWMPSGEGKNKREAVAASLNELLISFSENIKHSKRRVR